MGGVKAKIFNFFYFDFSTQYPSSFQNGFILSFNAAIDFMAIYIVLSNKEEEKFVTK